VTVVQSIQGNLSGTAALQFRLLDVKNIESGVLGLGRTDPFLEIEKKNSDADAGVTNWIVTHRTEQVIDNLNPVFKEFQIPIEDLCYCDGDWPLRIVVRDWQRNGKHRTLGLHETTFNGLKESVAQGGNADRTSALDIHKEGKTTTEGLLVVLKAEL
jgi:Ca2+-dependent lipid-binding protein